MMDWNLFEIGDVAKVQTGPFGSQLHAHDYVEFGAPVIMPTNIGEDLSLSSSVLKRITLEDRNRLRKYALQEGDIVYSRRGNVEKCLLTRKEQVGWLCGTGCLFIRIDDNTAVDSHFVAYQLSSPSYRKWIASQAVGTTMPNLNTEILASVPLRLPSLKVQRKVTQTLSLLDAKIDLLRRQNETLEAMGAAVFREWFVEGEAGNTLPLSEAGTFLNGLACQKYPKGEEEIGLPVLKIKQLRNGIDDKTDRCTADVPARYLVATGDLIFSWSASLIVKLWDGPEVVLNQHLFKVTSEDYPQWFMLYWCKYHLDRFQAIARAQATTMGHIKRGDLDRAIVKILSEDEMRTCDDVIAPILSKIKTNFMSIRDLIELRDLLLPKLMSGEATIRS